MITFESIGSASHAVPQELATYEPPVLTGMSRQITTFSTDRPTETLSRLISWARSIGHEELPALTVSRPTLEDIYLRLIQREDAKGSAS